MTTGDRLLPHNDAISSVMVGRGRVKILHAGRQSHSVLKLNGSQLRLLKNARLQDFFEGGYFHMGNYASL